MPESECLRRLLQSYLALGMLDVTHHLHSSLILGHEGAIHAVVIGIILVPTAIASYLLFVNRRKAVFLRILLSIAVLAVALPGLYHGGWSHVVKLLRHLGSRGAEGIAVLLPPDAPSLWFYETTGVLEFALAILCAYYILIFLKTTKL